MTIRTKPWLIDGNTHPAQDGRLAFSALLGSPLGNAFAGGVSAADPGHGVANSTSMKVTQNGSPNMSVNVALGAAFIRGTISALQGVYSVTNEATVNLTISAANAVNPRRDLVILQARDNAFDSGGINDARLVVVAGTPAASPVDPSLSSYPNALVLARVAVAANATSVTNANITDLRTFIGRVGVEVNRNQTFQSIANNTVTNISFDNEGYDPYGFLPGSGVSLTVPAGLGGLYFVSTRGVWSSSPGTSSWSSPSTGGQRTGAVAAAGDVIIGHAVFANLSDGDTFGYQVYQASGAAINFVGGVIAYRLF